MELKDYTAEELRAELKTRIKEQDELNNEVRRIDDAVELLKSYNVTEDESVFEHLESIKRLKTETTQDIQKTVEEIQLKIEENQKNCTHDWECVGVGSHYNYYRCRICGAEDRW